MGCYLFKNDPATYFDRFWVEHIPKEIKMLMGNKVINVNINRKKECDSLMYQYFCKAITDFVLNNKKLPDFTNIFSNNNFLKKW